jgi:hypothetical protein
LTTNIELELDVDLRVTSHVVDHVGGVVGLLDHTADDANEADLVEAESVELEDAVLTFDLCAVANDVSVDRHNMLDQGFLFKKRNFNMFIMFQKKIEFGVSFLP